MTEPGMTSPSTTGRSATRPSAHESALPGGQAEAAAARDALLRAAERTAALIRRIPDGSAGTKGLNWTLAETAAHLVADIADHADLADSALAGAPSSDPGSDGGERPAGAPPTERSAAANADQLAQLRERDPQTLADLMVPTAERFTRAVAAHPTTSLIRTSNGVVMTPLLLTRVLASTSPGRSPRRGRSSRPTRWR
jgi:hypothetical protein